jgi:uncharacterized protein involved in exopolysaccharide biosynthesis
MVAAVFCVAKDRRSKMAFEKEIGWCNDRIDDARGTLRDIDAGGRQYANGSDVTSSIGAKALATIATMTLLIAAYLAFAG